MNNKELEIEFEGTGEVDGMLFKQIDKTPYGYLYQVTDESVTRFEVFEKKATPICLDFANRTYSETDTKDSYPTSKNFGVWAWGVAEEEQARELLASLEGKFLLKKCKQDEKV